jgi:hypothetical protein
MAKRRRKLNKSQAIRDYLATNPTATPTVIKQALAKKGISVGDSLISQIKYRPSRGPARRGGDRPAGRRGQAVSLESLLAAKALAKRLGGIARAKQALSMLQRLV